MNQCFLPWAVSGGDFGRPPRDPSDPGARRPPPRREWGWVLLAAVIGIIVYAATHLRAHH